MKYSLIIDTTSKNLVIGLANSKSVLSEIKYPCWQRQSEFAIKEINNIITSNNISINDINEIIVTIGPGSYTGIRIGLCIAKVWTITKPIKIKALSSLLAMTDINNKEISVLDARSNRYYVGMYDQGEKVFDDKILTTEELLELIKANPDYSLVGETKNLGIEEKDINYSVNMFNHAKNVDGIDNVDTLKPIYLKEAY